MDENREFQRAIVAGRKIETIMRRRKKPVRVNEYVIGPIVTLFLNLGHGVKLADIEAAKEDLTREIGTTAIRICKSAPGKKEVLIEIPRLKKNTIYLEDLLSDLEQKKTEMKLPLVLGLDSMDNLQIIDLDSMPHMLIGGTSGSGKSMVMNILIMSLLHLFSEHELQMLMIDPKIVELTMYEDIPHLAMPVITDVAPPLKGEVSEEERANITLASDGLMWAVKEMSRRYKLMRQYKVRKINTLKNKGVNVPYLIIIIDEIAEIMESPDAGEVKRCKSLIQRLTQAGRAAGIHMIAATQRPSADVLSGTIKANLAGRIALLVTNKTNSRIIIDENGAELLQGEGDGLFTGPNTPLFRFQAPFIEDSALEKRLCEIIGG